MIRWLKLGLVGMAVAGLFVSFLAGSYFVPRTVFVDRPVPVAQLVLLNSTFSLGSVNATSYSYVALPLRLDQNDSVRVELRVLSGGPVGFYVYDAASFQDVYSTDSTQEESFDLTVPADMVYEFEINNNAGVETLVWLRVLP